MGFAVLAFLAGVLISFSRQINGRLSLSTSAMMSSFWNHIVGLAALTLMGLVTGALLLESWPDAPATAYLGGILGVAFIAGSSWLIVRIGAVTTAILIIAGNMVSGVLLDVLLGTAGQATYRALGVGLVLAGALLTIRRP